MDDNGESFMSKIGKRDEMMAKCGVVELCLCLWLNPLNLDSQTRTLACAQLTALVDKQWTAWVRHGNAVGLPQEYVSGAVSKAEFILDAMAELSQHLQGTHVTIAAARARFVRTEQEYERDFRNSDKAPLRRAQGKERIFAVDAYLPRCFL